MLADPRLLPVTCGWVVGVVDPAAMVTLAGEIVTLEVSPLLNCTVTPPAGAAAGRVTANAVDCPRLTLALAGRLMLPPELTVTLAVASGTFGEALAWITVLPTDTPVTCTDTLFAFAGIVAVEGTVATAVLSELRFRVTAEGVAAESVIVTDCVVSPAICTGDGEKLTVPVVWTDPLEVV